MGCRFIFQGGEEFLFTVDPEMMEGVPHGGKTSSGRQMGDRDQERLELRCTGSNWNKILGRNPPLFPGRRMPAPYPSIERFQANQHLALFNIHLFGGIIFQSPSFMAAEPMENLLWNPSPGAVLRLAEKPVIPGFMLLILFADDKLVPFGNDDRIWKFAPMLFDHLISLGHISSLSGGKCAAASLGASHELIPWFL